MPGSGVRRDRGTPEAARGATRKAAFGGEATPEAARGAGAQGRPGRRGVSEGSAGAAGGGGRVDVDREPTGAGAAGSEPEAGPERGEAGGGPSGAVLDEALRGIFSAPPPTGAPDDVGPAEETPAAGEVGEPAGAAGVPINYDYLRTILTAATGAGAGILKRPYVKMSEFEATLIAMGVARYAERQPDAIVGQIVEHSDVASVAIGGVAYVGRVGLTVAQEVIELAQQRRDQAARARGAGEAPS